MLDQYWDDRALWWPSGSFPHFWTHTPQVLAETVQLPGSARAAEMRGMMKLLLSFSLCKKDELTAPSTRRSAEPLIILPVAWLNVSLLTAGVEGRDWSASLAMVFHPASGRSAGEGTGYPLLYSWASLGAQLVKNPPAMPETLVQSLVWEETWRREQPPTPVFWPEESHGLYSPWGRKRVRHDWATFTFTL